MEREQVVTFLLSLWQRWADYIQTNFDNTYIPYVWHAVHLETAAKLTD
jgi:hypothetical protein